MVWVVGCAAFFVLVTANSGGYRFGVSDQAFYIPAIHKALVPDAFPRDTALLAPQAGLLAWDQFAAAVARATGLDLEWLFLGAYVLAVVVFFVGVRRLSGPFYREPLSSWALLAALTLRHRVAKTGVNTFEGYFHPRVLAFAIGVLAISCLWNDRRWRTAALIAIAFVVHPTTALWFAVWAAAMVAYQSRRWAWVVGLGVLGSALAAMMVLAGPLRGAVAIMDATWTDALTEKDYLFPTAWSMETWLVNAIAPVVLWGVYRWRQHVVARVETGAFWSAPARAETALVLGCLALLAAFVASLPFIGARLALAVQLQTSRVLWQVELLATVLLVWALAEAPWPIWRVSARTRAAAALVFFVVVSAGRAYFVLRVEHERPLVEVRLAESPWQRVTAWTASHTPSDSHFLVDPGHAWKFDSSFRVAARRDVLVEAVKDAAMATYSRDVALRVTERLGAIGDFDALTDDQVRALAARYSLDYLVAQRPLGFTELHREEPFIVYDIRSGVRP